MLAQIEAQTKQKVGIVTDEAEAFEKCDAQDASPLFTTLPRELRDLIWAYATAPYEDPNAKFEETAYYYRPGHTARLKTDTALLLTCRRIWLEANAMPMLQSEQSFYYHRAAPDARNPQWMASLTDHNRHNLGHIRLFCQMFAIEKLEAHAGSLRDFCCLDKSAPALAPQAAFRPRMLQVTIRHTDWWFWESEQPLRLEDHWVKNLLNTPDLRSTHLFKLELETLDYKADQLATIVQRIKGFESECKPTHVIDGKPTATKFVLRGEPEVSTWKGPANIDNRTFDPYFGKKWLKYHVVTLTWELRFPSIPRAFVPSLRLAPRVASDTPPPPTAKASRYLARLRRSTRLRRGPGPLKTFSRGMHAARQSVLVEEQKAAARGESTRRRRFELCMGALKAKQWEARWRDERSLLKFEGTIESQ
ncbi:hypothetical protein B0A50_04195 [Salinomyces thailandicus]|uniref:Uncharacterized protein n=1 Tax=Salinomyces thailandicus TaxID=706561 RepID=A0A4U0U032_9PEZI|nr:hypothetical protein B0A50_04195 [Salinomyces thailandica]